MSLTPTVYCHSFIIENNLWRHFLPFDFSNINITTSETCKWVQLSVVDGNNGEKHKQSLSVIIYFFSFVLNAYPYYAPRKSRRYWLDRSRIKMTKQYKLLFLPFFVCVCVCMAHAHSYFFVRIKIKRWEKANLFLLLLHECRGRYMARKTICVLSLDLWSRSLTLTFDLVVWPRPNSCWHDSFVWKISAQCMNFYQIM